MYDYYYRCKPRDLNDLSVGLQYSILVCKTPVDLYPWNHFGTSSLSINMYKDTMTTCVLADCYGLLIFLCLLSVSPHFVYTQLVLK